jgi:putative toxin-antitoxin system antitoxin component (TIGR02293 family)
MPIQSTTTATSAGGSPVVKLLGIKSGNAVHLIRAIERGFSFDTLEKVRRETGLPLERLAISIGVSPRTLSRRKKERRLTAAESDRLVSVSRLLTQAVELFEGDKERAFRWFVQANRGLGGLTPLEMAATETGTREVENLIGRLEHGVFS